MDYDIVIIGAGVVGLAIAENLSRNKYKILVIEKENRIGTGVSSRNSEVIHAGIYYPKGSLKSQLCIRGKFLLYDWCTRFGVPHNKIGKYIIATDKEENEKLEQIKLNASLAGMDELYFKTAKEIYSEEPNVFSCGALYSPSSGIVSVHDLMDSLKHKSEANNVDFLFCSTPQKINLNSSSSGYNVSIKDFSGEISDIETTIIINCAGLYSDEVAKLCGVSDMSYNLKFVKGNYFKYNSRSIPVNHLIYPVPMPQLKGLGIHITLDLNGRMKFGPDVEELSCKEENYQVTEERKTDFYYSIKKYLPSITPDDISPEMSGIRPRLAANNNFNDFIINEESRRGLPGLINCVGIESPGLTASLAIGEYISKLI